MIKKISSSLEGFKTLEFNQGLNILLADKSEGATDLQSRNGAGKTSFVNLVHFIFGSKCDNKSIFRSKQLVDHKFNLLVSIDGNDIIIERSGKQKNSIIVEGENENWSIKPKTIDDGARYEITYTNWCHNLGSLWFGLDAPPDKNTRFSPRFRSLFPYFARRQDDGGFFTPEKNANHQQPWNYQVALSYLLNLNWHIPQSLQELREREKIANTFRRAAKSGDLGSHIAARSADLRTELTIETEHASQLRTQLNEFNVISEYQELEEEANQLTQQIAEISNQSMIDQHLINDISLALESEEPPIRGDVHKLYEEASATLPAMVIQRMSDVEHFHNTVIQNRRSHLTEELESAKKRVENWKQQQTDLDNRRQQIMGILQSGGALEQFTVLSEELGRVEAKVESIRHRHEMAQKFESSKSEIEIERNKIIQTLRDDIYERDNFVQAAILSFERISKSLYEKAGSLIIAESSNGTSFEFIMESHRSKGIKNMQIFCFDLMLMELSTDYGRNPGFLIHDSHLFDGVDERQVAKALQLGAEYADKLGFQYIVTLNSDSIPSEGFQDDFNIYDYVLETKLTDATDDGGLFGIRF